MTTHLNWLTAPPTVPDLYFVAVELGPQLGMYDLASWDGKAWRCSKQGAIIGHIRFTDFMATLDLNWPKQEAPPPEIRLGGPYEAVWLWQDIQFGE